MNSYISQVGGTVFGKSRYDRYWPSMESYLSYNAWYVVFEFGDVGNYGGKIDNAWRVRPLLAF